MTIEENKNSITILIDRADNLDDLVKNLTLKLAAVDRVGGDAPVATAAQQRLEASERRRAVARLQATH